VFGGIDGYMDPHGFDCCNGRSWNAAKPESATIAMEQVVAALRERELQRLDDLSNVDTMLAVLGQLRDKSWHAHCSALAKRWLDRDLELLRIADDNRRALKL
jgi:hypothetical protein